MAEAIHCPSCSTRYRLRPERLKPVIRRAKCFSCGGVFPVGDIVQRLLAPAPGSTAGLAPAEVAAAQHRMTDPDAATPTLSLGDLDGVDSEILEKTLIDTPASLPEVKVQPAPPTTSYPPAITETTLSGYTSARDAIDKLFGSTPAATSGLKTNQDSSSMDVEATLSALESTLGGITPFPPPSTVPDAAKTKDKDDGPTGPGLTEEDLADSSSPTMHLSQEDLLAAIAKIPAPTPGPAAEPTVALRASDLAAARAETAPQPSASQPSASQATTALAPRPIPSALDAPESGSELLRLKIGEDIYPGLTMPQLIAWVEEGRILENHFVARQLSENWLEAHKVPGLRPVFERLRRERSTGSASLDPSSGDIAPKKSLFGGLFGKG